MEPISLRLCQPPSSYNDCRVENDESYCIAYTYGGYFCAVACETEMRRKENLQNLKKVSKLEHKLGHQSVRHDTIITT